MCQVGPKRRKALYTASSMSCTLGMYPAVATLIAKGRAMPLMELLGNIFWLCLMGALLCWAYDMLKPYFRK